MYAWRKEKCVKIGMTGSLYENLMCSRISEPTAFCEYRRALTIGISSSRIYQVARLLGGSIADVIVLGVFGPWPTMSEARTKEASLRSKFSVIPKEEMSALYKDDCNRDGYTEFVVWQDSMCDLMRNHFRPEPSAFG